MSNAEAFLTAIRDQPDDDSVRLIFADWLEERGDPRGAFVRGQVQAAQLPPNDPLAVELREQETVLLVRHGHDWFGLLPRCTSHVRFVRGLLHVNAEAPTLCENLASLGPVLPWIERLHLSFTESRHLKELAGVSQFAALSRLDLTFNRFGNAGVDALATAAGLASVRWLDVSGCGLSDRGGRQLASSPHLNRLAALHVGFNNFGPASAAALAQSENLAGVKVLDLSYNQIGDQGAEQLAASPYLASLEALYLSGNQIHREGALALARSESLPKLTALHLSGNDLTPASRGAVSRRFGEGVRC